MQILYRDCLILLQMSIGGGLRVGLGQKGGAVPESNC